MRSKIHMKTTSAGEDLLDSDHLPRLVFEADASLHASPPNVRMCHSLLDYRLFVCNPSI